MLTIIFSKNSKKDNNIRVFLDETYRNCSQLARIDIKIVFISIKSPHHLFIE